MRHFFKRLAWTDRLSEEERDRLVRSVSRQRSFEAGDTIVPADVEVDFSTVILNGLSCRQKILEGGARQITAFHIAGDFCDLHTYVLKRLPDSVVAMTACQVVTIPHVQLESVIRDSRHVARLLWASTLIDASIFRQWIVSLGRRSSQARLAHLFCELYLRFKMIDLTDGMSYPLPATQSDLSDVLGLSLVHTNRTCGYLRNEGLVTFAQQTVTIHDWERLQSMAEFSPDYLHLDFIAGDRSTDGKLVHTAQ